MKRYDDRCREKIWKSQGKNLKIRRIVAEMPVNKYYETDQEVSKDRHYCDNYITSCNEMQKLWSETKKDIYVGGRICSGTVVNS